MTLTDIQKEIIKRNLEENQRIHSEPSEKTLRLLYEMDKRIDETMVDFKIHKVEQTTNFTSMQQQISNLERKIDQILESLEKKYVTKESFWPVKTLTYGMVALLLTGIIMLTFFGN